MSKETISIDVHGWVQGAPKGTQARRRREVTEIILNTIATSSELKETCHLKGGTLMGLLYGSPRFTADIDLTSTAAPVRISIEKFIASLNASMTYTARALVYTDYMLRVHSYKEMPKPHSFSDGSTWPALKIKINYADRQNKGQLAAFEAGRAVEIITIDVSFNEPLTHIEILELEDGNELYAYGLIEVLAEKYRALIQQPIRNRKRRQDVYDIAHLLGQDQISFIDKGLLKSTIVAKSIGREVEKAITMQALANPEVAARAKADWKSLEDELEVLPDFDPLFEQVRLFYESLPW